MDCKVSSFSPSQATPGWAESVSLYKDGNNLSLKLWNSERVEDNRGVTEVRTALQSKFVRANKCNRGKSPGRTLLSPLITSDSSLFTPATLPVYRAQLISMHALSNLFCLWALTSFMLIIVEVPVHLVLLIAAPTQMWPVPVALSDRHNNPTYINPHQWWIKGLRARRTIQPFCLAQLT